MNAKVLEILDNSVRYTLLAWLGLFVLLLAYRVLTGRPWNVHSLAPAAARSMIVATIGGLLFFAAVSFTPLTFFDNFATAPVLEDAPLRLTALVYERVYEGFSLQGEVWNQGRASLEALQVRVTIWGNDRRTLETLVLPVDPQPLPAGSAGSFSLSYTKNSPFLYGYDVAFVDAHGKSIPHVKGFDVR
jgi:hypothetical protein